MHDKVHIGKSFIVLGGRGTRTTVKQSVGLLLKGTNNESKHYTKETRRGWGLSIVIPST